MKCEYIAPVSEEFTVRTRGTILIGSDPERTIPSSSGENITQDSEYDPW